VSVEWWTIGLGLAAVVVAMRRLSRGGRVSPRDVLEKIEAGASVVDVRSPGEFASGSYPGALNIPVQSLLARMGEIPKDRPVVLYCASGARSAMAAGLLRRAGHADVVNAGGLADMPRR